MSGERPLPEIMGILNVTPDSFSDGGTYRDAAAAVAAGRAMQERGADVIDVGGESTRPGAALVPAEEELRRVIPVVRGLVRAGVRVSVDTRKAAVMAAALCEGAAIINDISGLTADPESLAVVAASSAQVVLMHMRGTPRTMQSLTVYEDVVAEVFGWLEVQIARCAAAGIPRQRLFADPGIGFAKTTAQNLALLQALGRFRALDVSLLLGVSRKSLIAQVAGPAPASERLGGSLALALRGADAGVAMLRVHDVQATRQALRLWGATPPGAPNNSGLSHL